MNTIISTVKEGDVGCDSFEDGSEIESMKSSNREDLQEVLN